MVSVTFVLKAIALATVLVLTYIGTLTLEAFVAAVPGSLGISPTDGPILETLQEVLLGLSAVVVVVFFTAPGLLMLCGYAGAWIKHVVLRIGKPLLAVFAILIATYTGTSASLSIQFVPPSLGNPPVEDIVVAGVGLFSLTLLLSRSGALMSLPERVRAPRLTGRTVYFTVVELAQTPAGRLRAKEKEEIIKGEVLRFQNFLQTFAVVGTAVELILSFREGRGRVFIHAYSSDRPDGLQRRLVSLSKTSFPEFKVTPLEALPRTAVAATKVSLTGVPELKENPLEPLARYFLENSYEGEYRASFRRVRSNVFSRRLAARRQRKLAEKAEGQRTESRIGDVQDSRSKKDYAASVDLEESIDAYERRASEFALRVRVEVSGERDVAEGAASVLRGTLSNHRRKTALKTGSLSTSTLLLPVEAVPYVWVPQLAMGTEIAASAEFELPPALKGEITLGTIAAQSGTSVHPAKIPLDDLVKHVFVTGMTGMGKTTSCFNLLLQLYEHGIPFLVIEPVKTEYRSLLSSIPNLQVFTPGDEETAPFRLNIFEPPEGVRIQTHLENLEAAWNSSFVMYSPLPYVIKGVLHQCYRACGWNLKLDKRGRPVTFADFRRQAEKVSRDLGYEPKVLMDIEAALKTRINSLTLGGKGPMFDTVASIPVETILRRPTVLELRSIPNSEEKAFVAALILNSIVEHTEARGQSKQLSHLTLIEEAHRLLPNVSTAKGDPESADPRKRMVEQFADMLAELRAYGEGLAIVEQIPTKILPDAIKNTATKIVHRVPAADDREVLAGAMNMTEEQSAVLTGLKPGEAVVGVERHPLPIRIVAANPTGKFGIPVGEVSDEEVKRHMTEFYLKNPLPKAPSEAKRADLLSLVDAEWFRTKFTESYGVWHSTGDIGPLGSLLTESARKVARTDEEVLDVSSEILSLAVASYLPFDEKERERFPRLFMQKVERSRRDAGRA